MNIVGIGACFLLIFLFVAPRRSSRRLRRIMKRIFNLVFLLALPPAMLFDVSCFLWMSLAACSKQLKSLFLAVLCVCCLLNILRGGSHEGTPRSSSSSSNNSTDTFMFVELFTQQFKSEATDMYIAEQLASAFTAFASCAYHSCVAFSYGIITCFRLVELTVNWPQSIVILVTSICLLCSKA